MSEHERPPCFVCGKREAEHGQILCHVCIAWASTGCGTRLKGGVTCGNGGVCTGCFERRRAAYSFRAALAAREEPHREWWIERGLTGHDVNMIHGEPLEVGEGIRLVPAAAREDTERPNHTHKLKLKIEEGFVYEELIHPDQQRDCDPPTCCACGRSYDDEETERCYDCPKEGDTVPNCWLDGHENLALCLSDKVEVIVDVDAHWDGECPVLSLRIPEQEHER